MSELDGNLLKEISDEVDRDLAELSEEENDEQTTCEYSHEREQGDKEEGDSSSMVKRSSEGIIVSQKDVVKSTTNSSRTCEPQSALPLEALEIKKRYGALKVSAWKWAVKHFPKVPNSTKSSLNLPRLAETSPELVEFVKYISACTDKSWEYVYNEQRPKLVYGILGKMLQVLVFGHETFGATDEQLQILKERDLDEVHADGMSPHLHPTPFLTYPSNEYTNTSQPCTETPPASTSSLPSPHHLRISFLHSAPSKPPSSICSTLSYPPPPPPSLTLPLVHLRPTLPLKLRLPHPPKRSNSLPPRPPPAKDPLPVLPASSYRLPFLKGNDACSQPHGREEGEHHTPQLRHQNRNNDRLASLRRLRFFKKPEETKSRRNCPGQSRSPPPMGRDDKTPLHRTRKLARSKSERGDGE